MGACHGDDMFYLFSSLPLVNLLPGEEDQLVSSQLVGWWASFARSGQPAQPGWPPVDGDQDNRFWRIEASSVLEARLDLVQRFDRWTEVRNGD